MTRELANLKKKALFSNLAAQSWQKMSNEYPASTATCNLRFFFDYLYTYTRGC